MGDLSQPGRSVDVQWQNVSLEVALVLSSESSEQPLPWFAGEGGVSLGTSFLEGPAQGR